MLQTMAFGGGALLALLLLDRATERAGAANAANAAGLRLLTAARVFGHFLLAATLATACRHGTDLVADLGWMAAFGGSAFLLVGLCTHLGAATLGGVGDAALGDNLAAATALAAHRIAVAVLAANVFGGTSVDELGIAAASFAVGQLTLLALLAAFRWLTSYDDRRELLAGNVAAALSHGGVTVALALVIASATDGVYEGPLPALAGYAIALAEGLLVYPLRQIVVQCLVLRARPTLVGGALDAAIVRRDVGAGALEALTYLAAALFVRSLA